MTHDPSLAGAINQDPRQRYVLFQVLAQQTQSHTLMEQRTQYVVATRRALQPPIDVIREWFRDLTQELHEAGA